MVARKRYLRPLLIARTEWMEARVLRGAFPNGYGHITPALVRMFSLMGGRPIGLSDLARRLVVSRQAAHKLANQAADLGLVEFVQSKTDKRVKLIQFSQDGWAMSDAVRNELEKIEAELIAHLGQKNVEELRRILMLPWPGTEDEAEHPPIKPRTMAPRTPRGERAIKVAHLSRKDV